MAAAANATGHAVEGGLNFEAASQDESRPRPICREELDSSQRCSRCFCSSGEDGEKPMLAPEAERESEQLQRQQLEKDRQDHEQLQQPLQRAQQEAEERNKASQEATQDDAQLQQSQQRAQQEAQERDGAFQKVMRENEQLQQSVQRAQQEAQERETTLEEARQKNEQLQQSLQHSPHEVQGRDEALEEARRENKQLQRNVQRVQQEMQERDKALEKARQKNEQLQRSVRHSLQEVEERDVALEEARRANEQLQRSVRHSQQEMEERAEALEEARRENDQLQRTVQLARQGAQERDEALQQARQDNEQLQRSVQHSQQEVEKRGEALEKARQENEELQHSVRRARLEVLENDNRLVRLEASEMQHVQEKEKALGLAKRKALEQHKKSLQDLEKLHAQEMQKAKQKHDELEQAWWEDWWRWKRWAEEKEQEREQMLRLLETKDKVVQEAAEELAKARQETEQFQLQWATSSGQIGWQYDSGAKWANFTPEASMSMLEALLRGDKECTIQENGIEYIEDLEKLSQLNPRTGRSRSIRCNCGIPEHWSAKNEDVLRNLRAGSAWLKSFDAVMHEITDPMEHSRIETLLRDSVFHHDCCVVGGKCDQMKVCRLVKVWHVENLMLYRRYSGFRSSMQEEHTRHKVQAEPIEPAVGPELAAFAQRLGVSPVQTSLNEALLFHGTSWETALEIAKEGFDSRLANDGYWGRGTYFASQSCKSFQYSKPETSGVRTVILSRVALGRPYYVTEVQRDLQRPPKRENDSLRCDSVVARPGLMRGHQLGFQTHQEFVIYETAQSYPEFIVRYV